MSVKNNLYDDRPSYTTLLELVARGSAITTELQRLVDLIPEPFISTKTFIDSNIELDNSNIIDLNYLDNVINDFSYFEDIETFEKNIESNASLKKADQYLCNNYWDIINRFYLTFDAIQRLICDLNQLVDQLEEELVFGQTIESVISNNSTLQLICEAYYTVGYLLMTIDRNFEGGLREKIIVSYYRYSSMKSSPNSGLDQTCNLMRSTGYRCTQQQLCRNTKFVSYRRPNNYPESYFARAGVNVSIVDMIISKLQAVDIYDQTIHAFPHPDHRSVAYSKQASLIYVILYFCPNILENQKSRMREITDKFFFDNWIINVHMGDLCNIIEAWHPYRAARESLIQLYEHDYISNLIANYRMKYNQIKKKLKVLLKDGKLPEYMVLQNGNEIFNDIRDANFYLKWLLLQASFNHNWKLSEVKNLHGLIMRHYPGGSDLCDFFQCLSKLEYQFVSCHNDLLEKRYVSIQENISTAIDLLEELIEIFAYVKPVRWVAPASNESLLIILRDSKESLDAMKLDAESEAGYNVDAISRLIKAIQTGIEQHFDGQSLLVIQLFSFLKDSLLMMIKLINLDTNLERRLEPIINMSYGWRMMEQIFLEHLQKQILRSPSTVSNLDMSFKKLATGFESHLHRLKQLNAEVDLIIVTRYYSTKMFGLIRDILHVIPATIIDSLIEISELKRKQVNLFESQTSKLNINQLKQLACPETRLKTLKLTYKISHYAESMLSMRNTNIGSIQIDSKGFFESGLRLELRNRLMVSLNEHLSTNQLLLTSASDQSSGLARMVSSLQTTIQNQIKMNRWNKGFSENIVNRLQSLEIGNRTLDLEGMSSRLSMKLDDLGIKIEQYRQSFEFIHDMHNLVERDVLDQELCSIIEKSVDHAKEIILLSDTQMLNHYTSSRSERQSGSSANQCSKSMYETNFPNLVMRTRSILPESFMYRLLSVILRLTDPNSTVYHQTLGSWFDLKNPNHHKIMDNKVIERISSNISIAALNGLDELCACILKDKLKNLDSILCEYLSASSHNIEPQHKMDNLSNDEQSIYIIDHLDMDVLLNFLYQGSSDFAEHVATWINGYDNKRQQQQQKLQPHDWILTNQSCKELMRVSQKLLLHIGQLQAIRIEIHISLTNKCRLEARHIYSNFDALNYNFLCAMRASLNDHFTQVHANHAKSLNNNQIINDHDDCSEPPTDINRTNETGYITDINKINTKEYTIARNCCENTSRMSNSVIEDPDKMICGDKPATSEISSNNLNTLCDSELIYALTRHLEYLGLGDPMGKIYTTSLECSQKDFFGDFDECYRLNSNNDGNNSNTKKLNQAKIFQLIRVLVHESRTEFVFAQSVNPKDWDPHRTRGPPIDGRPFYLGLVTLLKHLEPLLINAGRPH